MGWNHPPPAEMSVLPQAWLALSNLLLEPATRGHYDLDTTRAAALVRLRRLLPEVGCTTARSALSAHGLILFRVCNLRSFGRSPVLRRHACWTCVQQPGPQLVSGFRQYMCMLAGKFEDMLAVPDTCFCLPQPVQEQLPVARDIARVLEAVEAGAPLQDSSTDSARLIMEQVSGSHWASRSEQRDCWVSLRCSSVSRWRGSQVMRRVRPRHGGASL